MKKQTAIWFYALGFYVILQLGWWSYHLVDLTTKIQDTEINGKQIVMIVGESVVFLLLLIFGLIKIRQSIRKEIEVTNRENNFLLSVTHELKTPLSANKLYIQTLLKRANLDREKQVKLLENAVEENLRLQEMIDRILTATQIESNSFNLNLEACDFGAEIRKIVEVWSKDRVKVTLELAENVLLKADLFIVKIVLINLLENAYKYGNDHPKIVVYLKRENKTVIWGVKDDGDGIPKEFEKDIFKKFFRIGNEETRSEKGTGLGLYIVKSLLSFHGDKIIYQRNIPKGADFKILRKQ